MQKPVLFSKQTNKKSKKSEQKRKVTLHLSRISSLYDLYFKSLGFIVR